MTKANAILQGRTKNEEHQWGKHSLYKVWHIALDDQGFQKNANYAYSFYNRTNPNKAFSYSKDIVKRISIFRAQLIDNQSGELLEVYENAVWRQPNEVELQNFNANKN